MLRPVDSRLERALLLPWLATLPLLGLAACGGGSDSDSESAITFALTDGADTKWPTFSSKSKRSSSSALPAPWSAC
jgi:hypothetical protein